MEGYNGNEIVFSGRDKERLKDENLRASWPSMAPGLTDNTGLGINVADKDNVVEVNQIKRWGRPIQNPQFPKGIIVSFNHESQYGGTATFQNLENEIEVSATYNSIELPRT